jgi:hypothetical protein
VTRAFSRNGFVFGRIGAMSLILSQTKAIAENAETTAGLVARDCPVFPAAVGMRIAFIRQEPYPPDSAWNVKAGGDDSAMCQALVTTA